MKEYIEDLENMDEEELKATRVLNGVIAGDEFINKKDLKDILKKYGHVSITDEDKILEFYQELKDLLVK